MQPPDILARLGTKMAVAVRGLADRTHRHGLESREAGLTRSAAVVLAVTIARLLQDPDGPWSTEEALVLDALRRSKASLAKATPQQLGDYLRELAPDQMQGVLSNVKGIYHELLFAAVNPGAVLAGATNQPGHDIEFLADGEIIRQVQLKAVASPQHISDHLARYPGIELLATEEVAARFPEVGGSGFLNSDLDGQVRGTFGTLTEGQDGLAALLPGDVPLIAAAAAASRMLAAGKVSPAALGAAAADLAVGATTLAVLNALIG